MKYLVIACSLLLVGVGCGPGDDYRVAPVSGTVLLDGKPLHDASVLFAPTAVGDDNVPGPMSVGTTDAEGKYSLITAQQEEGAVVGPHRVSITTAMADDEGRIIKRETLPQRYHSNTQLEFEVPEEGTDEADFKLRSR